MSIVVIESPYSGNIPRNVAYAQRAMTHSRLKGEIPIVTHLLWTQHHLAKGHFVVDNDPKYNVLGREASLDHTNVLRRKADRVIFYADYGYSSGMTYAIDQCKKEGLIYEERFIDNCDEDKTTVALRTQ